MQNDYSPHSISPAYDASVIFATLLVLGQAPSVLTLVRREAKIIKDAISNGMVNRPHQFREMHCARERLFAIPVVSSENRNYLPIDLLKADSVLSNKCFALYDAPLWNMALIASRLHWVWIGTVCVRLEMRFSYSNTLGWNTFPVPKLTKKNRLNKMCRRYSFSP